MWLFATPWTAAQQVSLSLTISWSLPKFMSIEFVMPSNHLILCHPLLLLCSVFPSIGVFSNKSTLHIRWSKYWRFSFSIIPSNEYSDWFPLGLTGWISLLSKGSMYCECNGWHNSIPSKETYSIFKYLSYLSLFFYSFNLENFSNQNTQWDYHSMKCILENTDEVQC